VSPNDVDVHSLAASVSTMAEKLEVVSHQIQKFESYSNRVEKLEAVQRRAVMGSDTLSAAADFPPVSAASTSSAMSSTLVSALVMVLVTAVVDFGPSLSITWVLMTFLWSSTKNMENK